MWKSNERSILLIMANWMIGLIWSKRFRKVVKDTSTIDAIAKKLKTDVCKDSCLDKLIVHQPDTEVWWY